LYNVNTSTKGQLSTTNEAHTLCNSRIGSCVLPSTVFKTFWTESTINQNSVLVKNIWWYPL